MATVNLQEEQWDQKQAAKVLEAGVSEAVVLVFSDVLFSSKQARLSRNAGRLKSKSGGIIWANALEFV